MASDENIKVVPLKPSSQEYNKIRKAFNKTVSQIVIKIERLQNLHLRQNYEVQKDNLSEKNEKMGGAREMYLFHGTSQQNSDSIIKNGFNRSFTGKNGAAYGQGTYFAVEASYSAQHVYSTLAEDGSQVMFVARVLTGVYTIGSTNMRVPPPVYSQQLHDRYDSLVDNMGNPKIYVVFNDNQAYPDYLITFR